MKYTHRDVDLEDPIDRESIVIQYIAISIFTVGAAKSLGLDDLLAAFAAGKLHFSSIPTSTYRKGRCRKRHVLGW